MSYSNSAYLQMLRRIREAATYYVNHRPGTIAVGVEHSRDSSNTTLHLGYWGDSGCFVVIDIMTFDRFLAEEEIARAAEMIPVPSSVFTMRRKVVDSFGGRCWEQESKKPRCTICVSGWIVCGWDLTCKVKTHRVRCLCNPNFVRRLVDKFKLLLIK